MAERLVVVGGDAGGMAAATQARRRRPDMEIVALEKGRWTSYSACGIPFLIGGDVAGLDDLVARDPQTFRDQLNIDVRTRHEVTALDLDARRVEVRDHNHGRKFWLGFDLLHLATGAVPMRPDLPGIDGGQVHGVQDLEDAARLLDRVSGTDIRHVVVVGGGYIGLEMAEAFVRRGGARVSVIARGVEVMGPSTRTWERWSPPPCAASASTSAPAWPSRRSSPAPSTRPAATCPPTSSCSGRAWWRTRPWPSPPASRRG